ncbi:MAG: right-handed parallel beta-helix repeat-containing protein [Thermoplasmatales archaeon]|nr:MAG: right-handed parallel beta-helix repeat-containing protein [Thermoplasmatales archaeon]
MLVTKKIIPFGIITLLLSMCLLPVTISTYTTSLGYGDVITVDDEGDGEYTSIKEAVNNASEGDTIVVYSGTYYEHGIEIKKDNITLIGIPYELGTGNDTGKPFIDGQGKAMVIRAKAENVTITGFRIENSGGTVACGIIGIHDIAHNCVISENDLRYSIMGCIGCSSNNNKFINNNISHSSIRQGIVTANGSKNNTLLGNVITDCPTGINFWGSNNNTVENNIIQNCGYGIESYGQYNTFFQNTIKNNEHGLIVVGSPNVIKNNNFIDNSKVDAFFHIGLDSFPFLNRWFNNYWGRPRLLPKPIFGLNLFFVPWIQFDLRPALLPYDI